MAKVEKKEPSKVQKKNISIEKKLVARADYRPEEGWFAIVSHEGSEEALFSRLSANEESAAATALTELQRLNMTEEP